jgi:hypothetical protein
LRYELSQGHGLGLVGASDLEDRKEYCCRAQPPLARYGVSRDVKSSALRQLEAAGWITVKRSACKNPIVTVVLANADGTVGD